MLQPSPLAEDASLTAECAGALGTVGGPEAPGSLMAGAGSPDHAVWLAI